MGKQAGFTARREPPCRNAEARPRFTRTSGHADPATGGERGKPACHPGWRKRRNKACVWAYRAMSFPSDSTTPSRLLSSFDLRGLPLRNRVVMAPLTRARAGIERVPYDLMVEYYTQRASAGLIIAEATTISEQGFGWVDSPGIYNDAQVAGWSKITSALR